MAAQVPRALEGLGAEHWVRGAAGARAPPPGRDPDAALLKLRLAWGANEWSLEGCAAAAAAAAPRGGLRVAQLAAMDRVRGAPPPPPDSCPTTRPDDSGCRLRRAHAGRAVAKPQTRGRFLQVQRLGRDDRLSRSGGASRVLLIRLCRGGAGGCDCAAGVAAALEAPGGRLPRAVPAAAVTRARRARPHIVGEGASDRRAVYLSVALLVTAHVGAFPHVCTFVCVCGGPLCVFWQARSLLRLLRRTPSATDVAHVAKAWRRRNLQRMQSARGHAVSGAVSAARGPGSRVPRARQHALAQEHEQRRARGRHILRLHVLLRRVADAAPVAHEQHRDLPPRGSRPPLGACRCSHSRNPGHACKAVQRRAGTLQLRRPRALQRPERCSRRSRSPGASRRER